MQELNYNNYAFAGHPLRITLHWTGGSYVPSSLDAEHYQFLIGYDGENATTYLGKYSVADQDSTTQNYAAHTRHFNTKNIGIALCGMAGAKENGLFGEYPITFQQIHEMVRLCAYLCHGYGITPDPAHLASHCEISEIHGVVQPGKWDVSALTFSENTWTALNDDFRYYIRDKMHELATSTDSEIEPPDSEIEPPDDGLKDTLDALVVAAQALEKCARVALKHLK